MARQAKGGLKEKSIEKIKVAEPHMWKVIVLNDDVTPIDFVIRLMRNVFEKGYDEANELTWKIHRSEGGVAGIYPKSIAEAKKMQAESMARSSNFPLEVKLERE